MWDVVLALEAIALLEKVEVVLSIREGEWAYDIKLFDGDEQRTTRFGSQALQQKNAHE